MPVDPEPDPAGEVVLVQSRGGEYGLVSPLAPSSATQLALDVVVNPRPRYRSHWSTCPSADAHRPGAVIGQQRDDEGDPWDDAA